MSAEQTVSRTPPGNPSRKIALGLLTMTFGCGLTAPAAASVGSGACPDGGVRRQGGAPVLILLAALVVWLAAPLAATAGETPGTTVMNWKDGKQAVFFLAFDDGCATHRTKVIPELIKRKIPGTFYVIAGNAGLFGGQDWAELAKDPNVVFGNHTFLHKDVPSVEHFEKEVVQASEAINAKVPHLPADRLVSFGKTGGVKWDISDKQIAVVLAKHNLIRRPSFFGWGYQVKTLEQMHAYIDKTIESGGMGHLDFHGVGGDWLVTPWDVFTDLLDTLEANRSRLWLTDAISYHKYVTERESAEVRQLPGDGKRISVELTSKADPKLYDMPLTLATPVPADWTHCRVTQGERSATVPVTGGKVMYDALPGGGTIVLVPAPEPKVESKPQAAKQG